jgi:hypothetical protein
MTVFANGLEVACKAQENKVIAAFPYVCMTPPQTPATPPGVPIPYPTFGMDSDTTSGTGTVFIGGKTVTQKNKSYYSKCTGNEAGCAPKKNVISSVNTGKEYAHAWSGDVKFDGEPVNRFSDISSNDHASPTGGGPPFPKIGKPSLGKKACAKLLADNGILPQPYNKLKCPDGYEKEHTVEVQFFTAGGVRDLTLKCSQSYDDAKAPCICMKAKIVKGPAAGTKRKTPHWHKSGAARRWLKANPNGKLGDFVNVCVKSTVDRVGVAPADRKEAAECLKQANMDYLTQSMGKTEQEVKDKKKCHGGCARAKAEEKRVRATKKLLKKAVVTAAEVEANFTKPTVGCTPGAC